MQSFILFLLQIVIVPIGTSKITCAVLREYPKYNGFHELIYHGYQSELFKKKPDQVRDRDSLLNWE